MSILSWGKPLIEYATSKDGAPVEPWKALDTPKEKSTQLTIKPGQEITAVEEGGDIVDTRYGKGESKLEFELFRKKGLALPFAVNDGIVEGEYAFRITPEDEQAEGYLIDRARLSAEITWSTEEGQLVKYTAKVLKPKTGLSVKEYVKGVGG